MRSLRIGYKRNPHQHEFHEDIGSKYLHLSGGFGCMSESSHVLTQNGLQAMGDIKGPVAYLSLGDSGWQWSQGTAPHPKGKATLYRVVHTHGEFVSTLFHRVFCADRTYRPVWNLIVGDKLYSDESQDGSEITHIEKLEEDWFWDCHVFGTNNYVSGGAIHHNSGKSHGLVMKAFQLSQLNRDIAGGCVVPSIADYKKDLLPLFEEILEINNIQYRHHRTDKWFQFPWTSARMYVATAEKKIRGNNWGWAVLNEVTLISHERYKETIGRVRVKNAPCPQIVSSGTPEGTGHWLHEVFIEKPMKGSRIIYADTRDNIENLGADYIQSLENSYDPIMLDAYLRGLFVNMKGNRFYYAYDPKRNDNASIERIDGAEVHVSLDYNVSPMIATLWNIVFVTNKDGVPLLDSNGAPLRKARAFDTIVIDDGADTHLMSKALYEHDLDPNTTTIYPDPAGRARSTKGPPDNKILEQGGWHKIKVRNVAPRFRQRQLAVCNMLAKGYIEIHPEKCRVLKKDLEAVEQDRATYEKIKDNPKLTHASDGMDYFIDIAFPLSGHRPDSRSIKYR